MRPFTFHPGPRLLSGDGSAAVLAEHLPAGPVPVRHRPRCASALGLTDAVPRGARGGGREVGPVRRGRGRSVEGDAAGRGRGGARGGRDLGRRLRRRQPDGCRQARRLSARLGRRSRRDLGRRAGHRARGLPLALVPTTAGTGSEATPVAVITCEGGEKLAVNSPAADRRLGGCSMPTLTLGMPRHLTAATGIDAMVHAVEAYHLGAAQESAVRRSMRARRCGCCRPICITACDAAGQSATRARRCCSARISPGSPSPMRRSPGSMRWPIRSAGIHHLPHGLTNALMLRHVLQHNAEAAREHYAELAEILDAGLRGAGQPGARARA